LCRRGRVMVGEELERNSSRKVDPATPIYVDGELIEEVPLFLMYHKPAGVHSTMKDNLGRPDLSGVLPEAWMGELHPVGRLDAETTGLLMFCADGKYTQRLLHPRRAIEREYVAQVEGEVSEAELRETLAAGVKTSDGVVCADVVEAADATVRLIVREGKHRMVRRLLANVGHPVMELHRVRYGEFVLGGLQPGQWRVLEPEESAWITEGKK